jgi:hypothetical protein
MNRMSGGRLRDLNLLGNIRRVLDSAKNGDIWRTIKAPLTGSATKHYDRATNAHFRPDKPRGATGKSLIALSPWLTLNHRVPGSSPGAPTNKSNYFRCLKGWLDLSPSCRGAMSARCQRPATLAVPSVLVGRHGLSAPRWCVQIRRPTGFCARAPRGRAQRYRVINLKRPNTARSTITSTAARTIGRATLTTAGFACGAAAGVG